MRLNSIKTVFFIILFLIPGLYSVAASEKVRVGVYTFEPLCTVDDSGAGSKGIFIDLLKHVAVNEKWELEYVPGTIQECMERLESGGIDILIAASYSQELSKKFHFTDETVISTWAQAYSSPESEIQTLVNLEKKEVGVVRDGPYNFELRRVIPKFNIQNCRIIEFNTPAEVLKGIEDGWIQVGFVDRLYAINHESEYKIERSPIVFSPVELKYAALKGKNGKRIDLLDYHLARLKKDKDSVYYTILDRALGRENESLIHERLKMGLVIAVGFMLLLGLATFILRQQVKAKTSELYTKNVELEKEIVIRKDVEEKLRHSYNLLEKAFSSMNDGLLITSRDGERILNYNNAAARLLGYGYSELTGVDTASIHEDTVASRKFNNRIYDTLNTENCMTGEFNLKRKDDTLFPAEVTVTSLKDGEDRDVSLLITIRDISERKELQRSEMRLRQAQKMESIGTMAGGIAHDFNNILTPILGYAQILIDQADIESTEGSYLNHIIQAANRAKSLVSQILVFSRQRESNREIMNVNLIIKEALKLIRASVPSTITIQTNIQTDDDRVFADPTEIHQVLMNLCSNAAHSMKSKNNGLIDVTVTDSDGMIRGWSLEEELKDTDYLLISIRDTGCGIAPNVINRIFDPFFTTKRLGEGTGMGLSAVHGIVQGLGGAISVETRQEMGTTFHVYIPKAGDVEAEETDSKPDVMIGHRANQERILFVDDETMIIDMAELLLKTLGYDVITCTNGTDAIELIQRDAHRFDLVITDFTMPNMTGIELSRKIKDLRADLPVILCTGYTRSIKPEDALKEGIQAFISKPFSKEKIHKTIKNVLQSAFRERETNSVVNDILTV